ncbi:hypothetical protein CEN44_00375 [Fischerella muscicola CCMEE 5323]|uniref:Uncharacterized protein n=1 Tax=Fischerella muscicola CCMEE 5323 TaxID=2019572 RepID=A0A2N6K9B1_FISMU|nr:hypothetical protein CEN44_00375 [Fischerella muscicola CCMEE 5323]
MIWGDWGDWGDGEVGRWGTRGPLWGLGAVGRWGDGEMGRQGRKVTDVRFPIPDPRSLLPKVTHSGEVKNTWQRIPSNQVKKL